MKNSERKFELILLITTVISLILSILSIVKANEANAISKRSNNLIEEEIGLFVRPMLDVQFPDELRVTIDEFNDFTNLDKIIKNENKAFALTFENIGNDLANNISVQFVWTNFNDDKFSENIEEIFSNNVDYKVESKNYLQQGSSFEINDLRYKVQLSNALNDVKIRYEAKSYSTKPLGILSLFYYWENSNDRKLKASYSCFPNIYFYEDGVYIDFFSNCIYDLSEIK